MKIDAELADAMCDFYADPLGWVLFSFEWGEGDLKGFEGPDAWQREFLEDWGKEIRERGFNGVFPVLPIQFTTGSGHGIGKSALVAWCILFILSTRPHSKGVVTANTVPQLRTKTWGELAKWRKRCITGHWFTMTTGQHLSIYHNDHPETWRADGQTCKEENSESFAGLHAATSTPFYIFDEASGIPDKIFEVAQGGLTDGEPAFFCFGNPTKNTGFFHDITFGRLRAYWRTRSIDSRTCKMTNKALIERWKEQYGEDSDFFKVRVLGQPPSQGDLQLIPREAVQDARKRVPEHEKWQPYVIGVDVARFGKHRSVIVTRRGRDARTIEPKVFRSYDTQQLADEVLLHVNSLGRANVGAVFIDGGGVGGGVVDRCRALGLDVIEVNFGSAMPKEARSANRRSHMYTELKSWLVEGGAIRNSDDLETELVAVEFGYDKNNRILLESKDDLVERLGDEASPDEADALALTFAHPVAPLDVQYPVPENNPEQQRKLSPIERMEQQRARTRGELRGGYFPDHAVRLRGNTSSRRRPWPLASCPQKMSSTTAPVRWRRSTGGTSATSTTRSSRASRATRRTRRTFGATSTSTCQSATPRSTQPTRSSASTRSTTATGKSRGSSRPKAASSTRLPASSGLPLVS